MPTPRPSLPRRRPDPPAPRWQIIALGIIIGGGLLSWAYQGIVAIGSRSPPPVSAAAIHASRPVPFAVPQPPAREWWQDGTLHNVSLLTWRQAAAPNKLATAADWLAATKWKGHISNPADMARIRTAAARLVGAVDTVSASPRLDYEHTGEVAGALIAVSPDLWP